MIRLTRGLRIALGLCLLALGVFGAGVAQASTWMVGGSNLTSGNKEVKVTFVGGVGTLHTKISGTEVDFNCTTVALVGNGLESGGKVGEGTAKFSGCTTKLNGTTQAKCEPVSKLGEKGVIVSNKGKGLLIEHTTGEGVTELKSTTEEVVGGVKQLVFGHVLLAVGCSISEDVPIIGPKLTAVDDGGMTGLLTEAKTHTIKEFAALTEIWALSKTNEHIATVVGKAEVELLSGELWSGLVP